MDNGTTEKRPLTLKKILVTAIALSFSIPAVVLMALFRGSGNIQETKNPA